RLERLALEAVAGRLGLGLARDARRSAQPTRGVVERRAAARDALPHGARAAERADVAHLERVNRGQRVVLAAVRPRDRAHQPQRGETVPGGVVEVQDERVAAGLVCEQERERARRIERWRTAEELLARTVHVV